MVLLLNREPFSIYVIMLDPVWKNWNQIPIMLDPVWVSRLPFFIYVITLFKGTETAL